MRLITTEEAGTIRGVGLLHIVGVRGPVTRFASNSLHNSDYRGTCGDVVSRNAGDVGVVEPVGH